MSLTAQQIETRAAWRKAKRERYIAAPGERDRTAAQLKAAATAVLAADTAARKERAMRRAA